MDELPATAAAAPRGHLRLLRWLVEGLRTGLFLRPRVAGAQPTPAQVVALLAIFSALEIGLARLETPGAASFDLRGWLAPFWSTAALLLLAWWALPDSEAPAAPAEPRGLAAWFALWIAAVFPAELVSQLLGISQAHDALPHVLETSPWVAWTLYLALWVWTVAAVLVLSARFGAARARLGALAVGMIALFALSATQFPDRPWQAEDPQVAQAEELDLSQQAIEAQEALLPRAVAALAPERPGVVDAYGIVFSPYAEENVFLRESDMVAQVLAQRFDAQGRVIELVNHPATMRTHPWATPANLERAIDAVAARMDRDNDVLVLYLTSHAATDSMLEANNAPLDVDSLGAADLRRMLDRTGIRHRVIAVSACYSGGWVATLAGEATLVMTAADAQHTSYGCGKRSKLTFFGRALFDEQLRVSHSFEQAFAAAVPVIRQREVEAGKDDGFSNPQISVGDAIRPALKTLQQRLDHAAAK